MSNRIKNNLKNLVGQTLNQYYSKVKPTISDLRYKQEYQNRIIECMVGEVDDNYITTPETDNPIVKLEHSKEGLVKIPSIKGKTILVDSEGNETDTPGEGCRLVSVGEDESNKMIILSKNKNLITCWEKGKYSKSNGAKESSNNYVRTPFINVRSEVTYKLTSPNSVPGTVITFDKDKRFIGCVFDNTFSNNTFTFNNNVSYVTLHYWVNDADVELSTVTNLQHQLEENVQATPYTPHKFNKTEILLNEPLRSLPNGVCDEIVGNRLIRRIGKIKLNGEEETWRMWTQFVTETHASFYVNVSADFGMSTYPNFAFGNTLKSSFKSNFFNSDESVPSNNSIEGICVNNASPNYIGIRILKERLITPDVNGFKQWLSNNLVEIIFQLAEPIIEELPNSTTLQGFDDTTMYIENSITPTVSYGYNALIPYKEELLNQKEEVETNTLDIEQNIIPYLMDMEYNLMLMEDN